MATKKEQKEQKQIQLDELENNQVGVELTTGEYYVLKEPKALSFIELESWRNSDEGKLYGTTELGLTLKIISLSICGRKIQSSDEIQPYKLPSNGFVDFADNLALEDVERLGAALTFFRTVFEYLASKNSV